jgi:hypothetical protein
MRQPIISFSVRLNHGRNGNWQHTWCWRTVELFYDTNATHPILRHGFREDVTQWFQVDAPDVVSPVLFPEDVWKLIQSQNDIGWRQIFRGRFSQEWQRIQNACCYMKQNNKSECKQTGAERQQQFITTIWELWFQLWALRNGEVHGITSATRAHA